MNYGDFKDLNRRAAADKALCDKAFNIVKKPKRMVINVELFQWSIDFFIKMLKMKIFLINN